MNHPPDRARRAILDAIGPAGGAQPTSLPPVATRAAPHDTALAQRILRFDGQLRRVGGQCFAAPDLRAARTILRKQIARLGARRLAVSDGPLAHSVVAPMRGEFDVDENCSKVALLYTDLGLSTAQLGIAETGTLVLRSALERHRLVSLVPPVHVALLRARDLLGTMAEALGALANGRCDAAVTWITGPSRTADIELELVVGVHGPRELIVILCMDDGEAA
jgi:L-lactate dehydrogenase complex protein LldG